MVDLIKQKKQLMYEIHYFFGNPRKYNTRTSREEFGRGVSRWFGKYKLESPKKLIFQESCRKRIILE